MDQADVTQLQQCRQYLSEHLFLRSPTAIATPAPVALLVASRYALPGYHRHGLGSRPSLVGLFVSGYSGVSEVAAHLQLKAAYTL